MYNRTKLYELVDAVCDAESNLAQAIKNLDDSQAKVDFAEKVLVNARAALDSELDPDAVSELVIVEDEEQMAESEPAETSVEPVTVKKMSEKRVKAAPTRPLLLDPTIYRYQLTPDYYVGSHTSKRKELHLWLGYPCEIGSQMMARLLPKGEDVNGVKLYSPVLSNAGKSAGVTREEAQGFADKFSEAYAAGITPELLA